VSSSSSNGTSNSTTAARAATAPSNITRLASLGVDHAHLQQGQQESIVAMFLSDL